MGWSMDTRLPYTTTVVVVERKVLPRGIIGRREFGSGGAPRRHQL